MQNSPVSGSLATVAVNPAAEEDFPDVYTDLGTMPAVYLQTTNQNRGLRFQKKKKITESFGFKWESVLEELGFSTAWIPNYTNIDVSSKIDAFMRGLVHTA